MRARCCKSGYFYFVVSHHHREDLLREYPRLLLSRAVEGLIAIDTPLERQLPIPVVAVSGHQRMENVTNLELDHTTAVRMALTHLFELGHRKIAFIKGQEFSSDTHYRWSAIEQISQELGLAIDPRLCVQLEGTEAGSDSGYQATGRLLERRLPFTALFAFNDHSAIGAIARYEREWPADSSGHFGGGLRRYSQRADQQPESDDGAPAAPLHG